MKTVVDKRPDLYRKYFPNKTLRPPIFDSEPEEKYSCFYDIRRREAGFGEIITPNNED